MRLELASEHQQVEQRRTELAHWLERCEQDLEKRAARLVARENELDRQQHQYEVDSKSWRTQRIEFQIEIQRLLGQQRQQMNSAA